MEEDAFKIRALSVFEQKILSKRKTELQKTRTKPQVTLGKEFKGDAFIPTPKQIVFKDFVARRTYRKTISLTNVSYTFNSFKLEPLKREIQNYFEIKYKLPGRMSAGTSVKIMIIFEPKVEQDINEYLVVHAETGKIKIPLKCWTKKVEVDVEPRNGVVDFGDVMLAESKRKQIVITNTGALPTRFWIEGDIVKDLMVRKKSRKIKRGENEHYVGHNEKNENENEDNSSEKNGENEIKMEKKEENSEEIMGESEREKTEKPVGRDDGSEEKKKEDLKDTKKIFKISALEGKILEKSKVILDIDFFPKVVKKIESSFMIKFGDSFTDEKKMMVVANGKPVSIYLPSEDIDFKWVFENTLYRETLKICNRSNNALKIFSKVPKFLRNEMEFIPKVGFVQPGKPFELQIKLRAGKNFLEKCKKFVIDENKNPQRVKIPVQIYVPDQAAEVVFNLFCNITESGLSAEPSFINFGKCSIHEKVSKTVRITNNAFVKQNFGVMKIPKFCSVSPNYGFFTILGKEYIDINIIFAPKAKIEYNFKIVLKTDRNEETLISCTGIGVEPVVRFSNNFLKLQPIAIGDSYREFFSLENTSKRKIEFEFMLGEDTQKNYGLSIHPRIGLLNEKEKKKIVVVFTPLSEFREVKKIRELSEEEIKMKKEEEKTQKNSGRKKKKKKSDNSGRNSENNLEEFVIEKISNYSNWNYYDTNENINTNEVHNEWHRFKYFSVPCLLKNAVFVDKIFFGIEAFVLKGKLRIFEYIENEEEDEDEVNNNNSENKKDEKKTVKGSGKSSISKNKKGVKDNKKKKGKKKGKEKKKKEEEKEKEVKEEGNDDNNENNSNGGEDKEKREDIDIVVVEKKKYSVGKEITELEFGKVVVGKKNESGSGVEKKFVVKNTCITRTRSVFESPISHKKGNRNKNLQNSVDLDASRMVDVDVDPLLGDPFFYTMLPRAIRNEEESVVGIGFCPSEVGMFEKSIKVISSLNNCILKLKGEGVKE